MATRKALKEKISNEMDSSASGQRESGCKRSRLRCNSLDVENEAQNKMTVRRSSRSKTKENDLFRTELSVTVCGSIDAVTSTPLSKSNICKDVRVPEFHLSPIGDRNPSNGVRLPLSSAFDNVAKTKSRLLNQELTTDKQKSFIEIETNRKESQKENDEECVFFCSPPSKSYSRTPRLAWSDDDTETSSKEDLDEGLEGSDGVCDFLFVANSKPTSSVLHPNGYEPSETLVSRKQTNKLVNTKQKRNKKKKLNEDANAGLYDRINKEFAEVDEIELCFV